MIGLLLAAIKWPSSRDRAITRLRTDQVLAKSVTSLAAPKYVELSDQLQRMHKISIPADIKSPMINWRDCFRPKCIDMRYKS